MLKKRNWFLSGALGMPLLLGMTHTLLEGMTMGIVLAVTLFLFGICVSLLQPLLKPHTRLLIIILLSSTLVTVFGLLIQSFNYGLFLKFDIYLPIISMSCILFWLAEEKASKLSNRTLLIELFIFSVLCVFIFSIVGGLREWLAFGSLFSDSELFFEDVHLRFHQSGLTVFALLPGGLFLLGFLIALNNYFIQRQISD